MDYVFVKDSEGYVFKKLASEIAPDEKVISEKEYMKISGLSSYEKKFGHGGARENAGRKQKFALPLKFQIRVTKEEKDFINYARETGIGVGPGRGSAAGSIVSYCLKITNINLLIYPQMENIYLASPEV